MLARRYRIAVGCIDHDNPAARCGIQIYVVHTDSCSSDNLQMNTGLHHTPSDLRLRADKQRIIGTDNSNKLLFAQPRYLNDLHILSTRQLLQSIIAYGVCYQNFEHGPSSFSM
ncbi:hypothetical protein D3C78_1489980 [compost metagenome]